MEKVDWSRKTLDGLICPECGEPQLLYCACGEDKARFRCDHCNFRIPTFDCNVNKNQLIGLYIGMIENKEGEDE